MSTTIVRVGVTCALVLATTDARADKRSDDARVDAAMARVRELFEHEQLAEAKQLLVETYAKSPRPDLLFALGQVELNLGNYTAAIAYYERFLATHPSGSDAALAQQAIGAAREGASRAAAPSPEPPPPAAPPPPSVPPQLVHRWDRADTVIAAIGGAVVVGGLGLAVYGYELGTDRSGTLGDYDARVDRSLTLQRAGYATAAGGVLVIAAAVIRWRVHGVVIVPDARPERVGMVAGVSW